MLAFLAGYVIGDKHLETRGIPQPCANRCGRRPFAARARASRNQARTGLGLFDYLARRLSICGNPQTASLGARRQAHCAAAMLTIVLLR
jgi:hypothetical protein